jgi:hypothetical protein
VIFDMERVNLGALTLIEMLDAGSAADIPFDEFAEAMLDPAKQAHVFYALAWVIGRREDKSLTYEQACEWDIIVVGEPDKRQEAQDQERAKAVVAVAALAGVSPREAEQMTMDEVEAVAELRMAQNRAQRRAARRKSA